MVLIIEDNCEKNVLKFRLISCDKNYSNFIISFTTLCLKITKKSLSKNLTHKEEISNNIANNLPQ
jgi:hypothetical protein